MQNEISVKPLVDILSKQLGKRVVMSGSSYVGLDDKTEVAQSDIDIAIAEQQVVYMQDLQNAFNNAIQNHLDAKAKEFRYDNMMSARSYAGYTNPFQTEAQTLATWCADCWTTAGTIQSDVGAGTRPMPTVDEVLAELPVYGA